MKVYFIMDSIVDENRNLESLEGITCLIEAITMHGESPSKSKRSLNPGDL